MKRKRLLLMAGVLSGRAHGRKEAPLGGLVSAMRGRADDPKAAAQTRMVEPKPARLSGLRATGAEGLEPPAYGFEDRLPLA